MATLIAQFAPGLWGWLIFAALLIAGWAIIGMVAQRRLHRALNDLRNEMETRINALSVLVRATPEAASENVVLMPAASVDREPASRAEVVAEVTSQTVLIIAAAVTTFLGKKVRIRSAKLLQTPYEIINPWAQQGRVVIQASHNLTQRGHWND